MTVTTDHNTSKLLVAFLSNLSSGLGMAKKIRRFGYSKLHNTECHIRQTLYHNNCVCLLTRALGWWDALAIVDDHVIGTEAAWHTERRTGWLVLLGTKQPLTCLGTQGPTLCVLHTTLTLSWGIDIILMTHSS